MHLCINKNQIKIKIVNNRIESTILTNYINIWNK